MSQCLSELNKWSTYRSHKKTVRKSSLLVFVIAQIFVPMSVQAQNIPAENTNDSSVSATTPEVASHNETTPPDQTSQTAQPPGTMTEMGHMNHNNTSAASQDAKSGMDHGTMNHDSMTGMQHSSVTTDTNSDSMGDMNMDYGSMQGGTAPENARDPNAYSDGYTLDSGPYALPGRRQLRMADEHNFASLLVDRLEAVRTSDESFAAFDIQAWYGRDYDRAVLKVEGEYDDWKLQETSTDLLWSHAISAYWNSQLGLRYDHDNGPDRTWLALGVQGLAPYWFEMDITAYVGDNGRTSLSFESEYEILFTQKLILQPRLEAHAYSKEDIERGVGSGLADASLGLRLRYEAWREWAPYIGLEWTSKFGDTADIAEAEGVDRRETRVVAGVRFWF